MLSVLLITRSPTGPRFGMVYLEGAKSRGLRHENVTLLALYLAPGCGQFNNRGNGSYHSETFRYDSLEIILV